MPCGKFPCLPTFSWKAAAAALLQLTYPLNSQIHHSANKSKRNQHTKFIVKGHAPHGHSTPLLKDVVQLVPAHSSCRFGNMHDRKPSKHKQQHPVHEIQHYEVLFVYHNAKPIKET